MKPNILLAEAPSSVLVGGARVPINASWRNGVKSMQIADDPALDEPAKATAMLAVWFGRPEGGRIALPEAARDPEAALSAALSFFNLGEPQPPRRPSAGGRGGARLWDWDYDAPRAIADFQREYRIDLADPGLRMHWWRFWSLFRGLSDSSCTMRAMAIRGARPEDAGSDDGRKRLLEQQRAIALPARTEEEARRLTNLMWGLDV